MAELLINDGPPSHGHHHEITLPDSVTPCAFKSILDFAYTGEISLSCENVAEILRASITLKMPILQNMCRAQMDCVTADTVLLLWETAEDHKIDEYVEKLLKIAADCFVSVTTSRDFLLLSANRLFHYLSRDDLRISSEYQVAEAGTNYYP